MFAIPGICALMVFILSRPQEFIPILQKVPLLHLFTAFAVLGWVIDVRLRRLQPVAVPTLPWVLGFCVWAWICTAVIVPDQLITRIMDLVIIFALYGTIAHGIQRFRTFQLVAGVLAGTTLFITLVCLHQGLSPKQCIAGEEGESDANGIPDGRECDTNESCRGPDAEPGMDYRCEHVGAFGTYSIEERVRYRGDLHDPNEVSLTICSGCLAMLIAFSIRKKENTAAVIMYGVGVIIVIWTVFMTQSRGGLIAAMLVPGIFIVRKYGIKAVIPALMIAMPVLALGGRSGESADESTTQRYEAWAAGLDMFHNSPIFGVGTKNFTAHHFLTAHNSFVLTMTELGLPGFTIFVSIIFLSFKTVIVGIKELRDVPGTEVATVWGLTLIAAMAGIVFQINTLSFAYHPVLWIFWALCGAWCSAVRHHRPGFTAKLTWRDFAICALIASTYAFVILPIFLKWKGIT